MNHIWKPFNRLLWPNAFEAGYQISNLGLIQGQKGKPTPGSLTKDGYYRVGLRCVNEGHVGVHKVVLATFDRLPNDDEQADHIDKNRRNNILNNLRWLSQKENGSNHSNRKVPEVRGDPNDGLWCGLCIEKKPKENFRLNSDGTYRYRCLSCDKQADKERYLRNKL